jgi:drug/metabolite transporter (DMT)-like permease
MIKDAPNNQELPFIAAVFTSLLCITFGANAVAIKISLSGLGPFTTAGIRFSIAAFAIYLWGKITRRSFGINKRQIHQLLILSIFFTVQIFLLYLGLNRTNASRGTLLINLQPFLFFFWLIFSFQEIGLRKRKSWDFPWVF